MKCYKQQCYSHHQQKVAMSLENITKKCFAERVLVAVTLLALGSNPGLLTGYPKIRHGFPQSCKMPD
jgi:hypothetical protein